MMCHQHRDANRVFISIALIQQSFLTIVASSQIFIPSMVHWITVSATKPARMKRLKTLVNPRKPESLRKQEQ